MTKEPVEQKPFVTIDDVQINIEDLPEEGQGVFGRLQRLNQKKANLVLDLEEIQAGINFFSNRIVDIVNEDKAPAINGEGKKESSSESDKDSE
jgi:hypothetical protein